MTDRIQRLPLAAIAVASALTVGAVAALAQSTSPSTTSPGTSATPSTPSATPSAPGSDAQSGPAARPVPTTPPERSATSPGSGSPTAAADLVGMTVVDKAGKNVGSVTKVNRSPSGSVDNIEISTGGFLGIGAKTHTVSSSQFEHVGQQVVLKVQPEELK